MDGSGARVVVHLDRDAVHRGEQLGAEHVGGRAAGADPAVGDQVQLVGHRGGVVEVVQHEPDGDVARVGEVAHEVEQLHLVAQVEERRRLVEQQHAGVLGEAAREPDALELAAGQLVDRAVGDVRDAGEPHHPVHRGRALGVAAAEARAVGVPTEPHDVAHGEPAGHRPVLRQQGDLAGERPGTQGVRVAAVAQAQQARVEAVQPGEPAQQGRLPAAVGAYERGHPPRLQPDVRGVHDGAGVVAEIEPAAFEPDPCRHRADNARPS